MLGANWFYQDVEYPALQTIYPDLNDCFLEDPEFDPFFAQPLLQPNSAFTSLEEKFWSYMEPTPER